MTQKGARSARLAPAPFHTLVSADFWVSRDFSVGGFARIQIVEFAFLGGGRFQYRMSDSGAHGTRLRVGGGVVMRHLVKLEIVWIPLRGHRTRFIGHDILI